MSFFDQIKKERTPAKKVGYQWIMMLIKYDVDGNGEVVKTRTFPGKESDFKFGKGNKSKKKDNKIQRVELEIDGVEEEDLFD